MDEKKCPICNAPNIGDYTNEHIVCRVCNTDLSVYMQLNQFKGVVRKTSLLKRWLYVSCILGVFVTCGLCAYGGHQIENYQQTINDAHDTISALKDTIKVQSQTTIALEEQNVGFKYTVRKGDSFWYISKKIYGTGIYAIKIATDNNMNVDDSIHMGDILIIKN